MSERLCLCGKKKPFAKCCGLFLSGKKQAKTPEQLMRSRYSAYALGGYGEYLLSTWLPASAIGLSAASLSEKTVDWKRLEVIASSQQANEGSVEFKAWFLKLPNAPEMDCMHEISQFTRIKSRWYYVGGNLS